MNFQIYKVGGAVRDALLGVDVSDIDYVVVGATPQQMMDAGFKAVGKDFPVFLHPTTHQEYALARTERKVGQGYRGFVVHADPSVTLEQDLLRRDLTINAMAQDQQGNIIDPFNGQADLDQKIFRHVSNAFVEDPVRILRLARFAARLSQFSVAPVTAELMCNMVQASEVDALVPERVWQEISRGLLERTPSRMLRVLHDCAALQRLIPGMRVDQIDCVSAHLDAAAQSEQTSLEVRYALLTQIVYKNGSSTHAADNLKRVQGMNRYLHVPSSCARLAQQLCAHAMTIARAYQLDAVGLLTLIVQCDAIRKPAQFIELLEAVTYTFHPNLSEIQRSIHRCKKALEAVTGVLTKQIADQHAGNVDAIKRAIEQARLTAIQAALEHD